MVFQTFIKNRVLPEELALLEAYPELSDEELRRMEEERLQAFADELDEPNPLLGLSDEELRRMEEERMQAFADELDEPNPLLGLSDEELRRMEEERLQAFADELDEPNPLLGLSDEELRRMEEARMQAFADELDEPNPLLRLSDEELRRMEEERLQAFADDFIIPYLCEDCGRKLDENSEGLLFCENCNTERMIEEMLDNEYDEDPYHERPRRHNAFISNQWRTDEYEDPCHEASIEYDQSEAREEYQEFLDYWFDMYEDWN